jgi:hypothetical protein
LTVFLVLLQVLFLFYAFRFNKKQTPRASNAT